MFGAGCEKVECRGGEWFRPPAKKKAAAMALVAGPESAAQHMADRYLSCIYLRYLLSTPH